MKFEGLLILLRHFPTQDEVEDKVSSAVETPLVLDDALKEISHLATQLTTFLKRVPIKTIYSSDSNQALQTAHLLAERTGLNVIKTSNLRNIRRPLWEGLTNAEVQQTYAGDFKIWCETPGDLTFENGENIELVRKRVREFCDVDKAPKVIITHTTTFHSFILENFNLDSNKAWDFKPEMYCFTVLYNGTLWALNTRNLDYLSLNYK